MGQRLIGRLAAYGFTLALAGSTRAQAADAVSIELFSDGRCAVSAKGEGFRSTATYKPQVTPDPHELRCAMPPVPAGRTIALTVTLPPGTRQPAGSLPSLAWSQAADRWTGTAELADWPDTVTISTSSRLQTLWAPGAGLVGVVAALVVRRRRRRQSNTPGEITIPDR